MNNLHSTLRACAVLISFLFILAASASLAQAQSPTNKTWVSAFGDDKNPGTRTAPCRTFAGAMSRTLMGGFIAVMDPGEYGSVVIGKSITIDGTGVMSSIVSAGTSGIRVIITAASDTEKTVRIRGLTINGMGAVAHGITVEAAKRVTIEDTIVDGFQGAGVNVAKGQVFIRNTTIRNNGDIGLTVETGAEAAISDVNLIFNHVGMAGPIKSFNNVVVYEKKN